MHRRSSGLFVVLAALVLGLCGISRAATISLEGYHFDPRVAAPSLPPELTASPADFAQHGYFLVQTDRPITENWRGILESKGAELYGYYADYTFLVGLDQAAQSDVRALPGVVWMGPFQPAFKIATALSDPVYRAIGRDDEMPPQAPPHGEPVAVGPTGGVDVIIRCFRDLAGVARSVEAAGGHVAQQITAGSILCLEATLTPAQIASVARVQDVWWIEGKGRATACNNDTRWVIQSNVYQSMPLWDHGLLGQGQIATLMDSGLDYSSCYFRDNGDPPPGPNHRKVIDYSLAGGNPYDGCSFGHGTFVAGVMLGDQSYINPGNINYNGMAYEAKVTVEDVGPDDPTSCNAGYFAIPAVLTPWFDASYSLGARVHNDSWGYGVQSYTEMCYDVDFAMWEHPDYLVCIAAGNEGPHLPHHPRARFGQGLHHRGRVHPGSVSG